MSNPNIKKEIVYDDPSISFCDGHWKGLTFNKTGQEISIKLNKRDTTSKTGNPNIKMNLDLTSAFHLGGLKAESDAETFVKENGLNIPLEGLFLFITKINFVYYSIICKYVLIVSSYLFPYII